jgi:hypothetical protein
MANTCRRSLINCSFFEHSIIFTELNHNQFNYPIFIIFNFILNKNSWEQNWTVGLSLADSTVSSAPTQKPFQIGKFLKWYKKSR